MNSLSETCFDPIFVVGCPRSGTSITSHTLSKHSELWLSAESDFMVPLLESLEKVYAFGTARDDMHWLVRQKVSLAEFRSFIMLGINAMYTQRAKGKRWIEQTPLYSMIIDELAHVFPGAVFIHVVRDGRDVVNSMYHSDFNQEWSGKFGKACKAWNLYLEKLSAFEEKHPERILQVRNEELRSDPEVTIRTMCAFAGIDYQETMLRFLISEKSLNSSHSIKDREKKDWRNSWSDENNREFKNKCGKLMQLYGYFD